MKAEILVGPERRRRWSGEEKARIVADAAAPGANADAAAQPAKCTNQLLTTGKVDGSAKPIAQQRHIVRLSRSYSSAIHSNSVPARAAFTSSKFSMISVSFWGVVLP
jgi:transposase